MDDNWIFHLDQQMKANRINSWGDIVAEIKKKMDIIFPMMKRVMTLMNLKQQKNENLQAFIARLDIMRQTLDWDNWDQNTRRAVDLFSRLYDPNFKDRLMSKA